jgi:hypothetical protein
MAVGIEEMWAASDNAGSASVSTRTAPGSPEVYEHAIGSDCAREACRSKSDGAHIFIFL